MGELRLSGLSTGIDTTSLVQQLMEIERRRLNTYNYQVQEAQQKKDAVGELSSVLSKFKSKAKALSDSSQLKSFETKTSDSDTISASANNEAIEGSHSIQVKQLATSERWVHDGFKYKTSEVVGAAGGTFIINYNNQDLVLTLAANSTLEDLVGLINNDPDNPGIDASILKYDNGSDGIYHLVLSGRESGGDFQISINPENSEVWKTDTELLYNGDNASADKKIIELSNYSASGGYDQIRISGKDHNDQDIEAFLDIDSYATVNHLIDAINEAYGGTAVATYSEGIIKLTDTTYGASSMTLSLETYNSGSASVVGTFLGASQFVEGSSKTADIASLASGYFMETQDAQDSLLRVDDYPPFAAKIATTAASTSGSYTLTYGGETTGAIAYDADTATVQAALEALSTVNSGDITVSGTGLNATGSLIIQFNNEMGAGEFITFNSGTLDGTHTKTEQGWISRNTNTVDDVIQGVTLNLHNVTYDKTSDAYDKIDLTLTRDTEDLKGNVQALVDTYNDVVEFFNENSDYDPETEKVGILFTEYALNIIESLLKSPFSSVTTGFTDRDSFFMPKDIGIEFEADGTLKLDASAFDAAITENYADVLSILGAQKTGSSTSDNIRFYDASDRYTTAGLYEVSIEGDGSTISSAKIRKQGESTWRDMDIDNDGDFVSGGWVMEDGKAIYGETGLTLSVDVSKTAVGVPLTATISVKQGFAGKLEELASEMLQKTGRVPVAQDSLSDKIDRLNDRIEEEQYRLEKVENRLVMRYARLESQLTLIQQQFAGL